MSTLTGTGYIAGDVLNTDAQIAALEQQIECGEVEQLITVALLKGPGSLCRVSVATMGADLARAREMLRLALESCERVAGQR